jgi:alpha-galactosidase
MDYAMLSRHSIQSSSDQTDYMKNAAIAASACAGLTPEQCAVWSYPLATDGREEVVVNMVNAMLMRIHQSGHLAQLSQEQFALVKEGIACYKKIRGDIKNAIPTWPIKTADFDDSWFSFGLDCGDKTYLAVWRNNGRNHTVVLPIRSMKGRKTSVRCIYPLFDASNKPKVNQKENTLAVTLPHNKTARLFELDYR